MSLAGPIDLTHLLTCFFASCETQFQFLESQHGFACFKGLASYERGRQVIRPFYQKETPPPETVAVTRYEKDDNAIELVYDGRDYSLSGFALYNRIDRLPLADIAQSARADAQGLHGKSGLCSGEQIEQGIHHMASAFRRHARLLTAPEPALLEQARAERAQRMEAEIFARYHENMEYACRQAALAFSAKDYWGVVELLALFERHLDRPSRKRLIAARRKLTDFT
jgi:hypothetical protein